MLRWTTLFAGLELPAISGTDLQMKSPLHGPVFDYWASACSTALISPGCKELH
jgi:hypothetical protein